MSRRVLVAATLLSACAAHQRVAPPARAVEAPRGPGALEAAVSARCGACHDGDPSRPTFDGKQLFSRREAMAVGLAIASEIMPPPPKPLDAAERQRLLQLTCERTAEGEPASACLARLVPTAPSMWLVHPNSLRLLVDATVGPRSADSKSKPLDEHGPNPLVLTKPEVLTVRLGLTIMTLLSIYAADRCRDATSGPEDGRYGRCLERALDYTQGALPSTLKRTP